MSEDLQNQRYYVLERISELREQIPQAMQAMVVFRARIEVPANGSVRLPRYL